MSGHGNDLPIDKNWELYFGTFAVGNRRDRWNIFGHWDEFRKGYSVLKDGHKSLVGG